MGVTDTARCFFRYAMGKTPADQLTDFVVETISSFFTADLASCTSSFLRSASGSFGLAVSCATEPDCVVLAAMGQPMSFAVDPMVGMVLYGSEVSAVRIPVQVSERERKHYIPR